MLKNAIEATKGEGGQVSIIAEKTADLAVVTIKDNGWGFGLSQAETGTGLGLGICKWVLGKRGGGMEIKEAEEGGCVVKIYLPIVNRNYVPLTT